MSLTGCRGMSSCLTPTAGRPTQQLPGPRVVDGVLPAGRVLLAGSFILGARHGVQGDLVPRRKNVPVLRPLN